MEQLEADIGDFIQCSILNTFIKIKYNNSTKEYLIILNI